MRSLVCICVLACACAEPEKSGPPPIAGTGGMVSQGSSPQGGQSNGTGDSSGVYDPGVSSDSSGSSSGGLGCVNGGDACDTDGVCIAFDDGWGCGRGVAGDPCEVQADCPDGICFPQPAQLEAPGVCTGLPCELLGAPCEDDGTCVTTADDTLLCSHGSPGEPCSPDVPCTAGMCQQYGAGTWVCR